MNTITHLSIIVLVVLATGFSAVAVLGYFRLPDVYCRLHTTGKIGVFAVAMLLTATAIGTPVTWGHAAVLIFFLLATGPSAAHAIGSAAFRIGLPRRDAVRDDLADKA